MQSLLMILKSFLVGTIGLVSGTKRMLPHTYTLTHTFVSLCCWGCVSNLDMHVRWHHKNSYTAARTLYWRCSNMIEYKHALTQIYDIFTYTHHHTNHVSSYEYNIVS